MDLNSSVMFNKDMEPNWPPILLGAALLIIAILVINYIDDLSPSLAKGLGVIIFLAIVRQWLLNQR